MKHIILTQGYSAKVDNEDYDWLNQYQWCLQQHRKRYYAMRCDEHRHSRRMSIDIMLYHGKYDSKLLVDHINRNGLDNQLHNLRMVTNSINVVNRDLHTNNTSGYRGIWLHTRGKWQAEVRVYGTRIFIGTYNTAEEAARAYDRVAYAAFKEYSILNFPNEIEKE